MNTVKTYIRKACYYETDKMGIIHHSNYVRWMEEARIDFLGQIGMNHSRIEGEGLISPVVSVNCKYKAVTRFDDTVAITVRLLRYTGVRLVFGYEMKKNDGVLVLTAESEHCFTDEEGKPISLKKHYPHYDEMLGGG